MSYFFVIFLPRYFDFNDFLSHKLMFKSHNYDFLLHIYIPIDATLFIITLFILYIVHIMYTCYLFIILFIFSLYIISVHFYIELSQKCPRLLK